MQQTHAVFVELAIMVLSPSLMKADTICCYCISKQAHDKRGIEESLHAQITRARL